MLPPFPEPTPLSSLWNRATTLRDVDPARLRAIAARRVLLAHASLGQAMAAGVQHFVDTMDGVGVRVMRGVPPSDDRMAAIIALDHAAGTDARNQAAAFADAVTATLGSSGGIALFGYTASDVTETTDVDALFAAFRAATRDIEWLSPRVQFVPMTIPLTCSGEPTITRLVTRSLGRDVDFERNRRRNRFNRLLIDDFAGSNPVFDLARLQSTRPDGTRAFEFDGHELVYSLASEYTNADGGLNDAAQRMLAEQLLVFLAGMTPMGRPGERAR
jgi:hypothetical protein